MPALGVVWVDEALHRAGVAALHIAGGEGLSLVDCVSFEVMRRMNLKSAFAFDRHFTSRGYLPPS